MSPFISSITAGMDVSISEELTFVLVAIVFVTLISASIEDINTRTVRDGHWALIGGFGVVINLFMFVEEGFLFGLIVSTVSIMIMWGILNKRDYPNTLRVMFLGILISMIVFSYFLAPSDAIKYAALSVPVFSTIFLVMYYTGLLRGGADAKCMISLAVAFPVYPLFLKFPLVSVMNGFASTVFSFSLAVLFHALLFTILLSIPMLSINLKRKNIGKAMFSGYVTDVESARKSYVWPMYDVKEGRLVGIPPTENVHGVYDRLEQHGERNIWVTPMIPFIVPITISFFFTLMFGNPVFLILSC